MAGVPGVGENEAALLVEDAEGGAFACDGEHRHISGIVVRSAVME